MAETTLTFLGTTAALPDPGDDAQSFVINGDCLFDTGFGVLQNLQKAQIPWGDIKYLFITHFHHDHYMSLPAFLFALKQSGIGTAHLTILGPEYHFEKRVKEAVELGMWDESEFKTKILSPGDSFETERFIVESIASQHAIPGLCYRYTDKVTGKVIGITGDTSYQPTLAPFFKNCDALIHEVYLGMSQKTELWEIRCGHSTVPEAVRVAKDSEAKRMFFVHHSRRDAAEFIQYAADSGYPNAEWADLFVPYHI